MINKTWCFVLFFFLVPSATVYAQEIEHIDVLVKTLQKGGYNLYFRHEATNWSQDDFVHEKGDWVSCDGSKIRQLSDEGRQRATRTGQIMKQWHIPVSEVIASPYCRAVETAERLDLGDVKASHDVINLRVADYFGGRAAVVATARKLLALQPLSGTNRIIVAHGNVAQAATPVYPGEGEMVVFEPDGTGGFNYVGRISPEDWLTLKPDD